MADDDNWTSAASTDTSLVAMLLLRLKHSTPSSINKSTTEFASSPGSLMPFRWELRKARSRPDSTRFSLTKENKERVTRSPTTPLSWSVGCGTASGSGSGNVDGCDASSRSKITTAAYELASGKKAKRKRTYTELKKEECLLLDERINLKRDLAKMQATLTHYKMTNQNLKNIKGMNVHSRSMFMAVAEHPFVCFPKQTMTSTIQNPILAFKTQDSNNLTQHPLSPSFSSENSLEAKNKQSFTLPDLNMLPSIN